MKTRSRSLLLVDLVFTSCGPLRPSADLVLRGGKIYALDDARSWAEALAVDEGRIVFVHAAEF